MELPRRLIALAGAVGLLHSCLVPPVSQAAGAACRYHAFMERGWPFTREYGVVDADPTALASEVGLILAVCGLAWAITGVLRRR